MPVWHGEPGAKEWRDTADAMDQHRGVVLPMQDLSELTRGRAELFLALQLSARRTACLWKCDHRWVCIAWGIACRRSSLTPGL